MYAHAGVCVCVCVQLGVGVGVSVWMSVCVHMPVYGCTVSVFTCISFELYMCITTVLYLQEIELQDFTQHTTPKPSATSPAPPGYDFTPFTDLTHKTEQGHSGHKAPLSCGALSPPNFDFTSMRLNSGVMSPLRESGSGGLGAVRRRGRRYSDRFGNMRELRSLPYSGKQLWSDAGGMNLVQNENAAEETASKRSGHVKGKSKAGTLTELNNSKWREMSNEHVAWK